MEFWPMFLGGVFIPPRFWHPLCVAEGLSIVPLQSGERGRFNLTFFSCLLLTWALELGF